MPTDQQRIVELRDELGGLHEQYKAVLATFRNLDKATTPTESLRSSLQDVKNQGLRYFNRFEQFVANSHLLGAHANEVWANEFAEDCCEMLKTLAFHHVVLQLWCPKLALSYSPLGDTAYAGMQRLVAAYLPVDQVEKLVKCLEVSKVPTYGFSHPLSEAVRQKPGGAIIQAAIAEGLKQPRQQIVQIIQGDVVMSDKIDIGGNVTGSAVGSAASITGDVKVYQNSIDQSQNLDADLKDKLKAARQEIENLNLGQDDKRDLIDDFTKLTAEVSKPQPEVGRVQRLWTRIKEAAPTIASLLASAAALGKMLS